MNLQSDEKTTRMRVTSIPMPSTVQLAVKTMTAQQGFDGTLTIVDKHRNSILNLNQLAGVKDEQENVNNQDQDNQDHEQADQVKTIDHTDTDDTEVSGVNIEQDNAQAQKQAAHDFNHDSTSVQD